MPSLLLQPVYGASGYQSAPNVSCSGAMEPLYHSYQGCTNASFFVSWDGKNDAVFLPAASPMLAPQIYQIAYKSVWIRSANGVTGAPTISLFTKQ